MSVVAEKILAFNNNRLPGMLGYKFEAMKENAFRFFRATCHLFFEDLLIHGPKLQSPVAWISGDLHLENFGSYKGDNRLVYFDLNDFDESALAPVHWEITRLAASIFVAFQSLKIERNKAERLATLLIKSYSDALASGKAKYIERQTAEGLLADFLEEAGQKKHRHIIRRKTILAKDSINIQLDKSKHLKPGKALKKELINHMQEWLLNDENSPYNYRVTDCAFRIAGTGSLGVYRYVLLLKSSNRAGSKYLLLDMKQAMPSGLVRLSASHQPAWASEAERIKTVQTMMQNRPPALLSTTSFRGADYIVQELQPEKDSINFKLLKNRYRDMCRVVADMGMLTAASQLRSSGRLGSASADDLVEFGTRTDWQSQIVTYADKYAQKAMDDFTEFLKADVSAEQPENAA